MIVLALVFMASLMVFISLFDINRYHDQLEAGFSVALGRQLTIEGPLEFHLSLSPSLIAQNVRIANLPWASQPAFFHANQVEIQVSLIPLLNRELIIDHLIIEDGGLFFEEGTEGVDNWTFRGKADPVDVSDDESFPLIGFGGFAAITVQRSTISFFSHSNETTYQVEIDDGSIVEISEKLDKYVIEGSFRDVPIALDLVGGKIFEMGSHTDSWPLDGTIRTAGSTLALRGEFLGSNQEGSFDFNLGLKGDRLSSLNSLISQDLPAIGPYTFSAKVSDSEKELHVENLKARIKNSHLTGNLTLSTQGLRTQVQDRKSVV
jgi:uncharacterized protein involved in outer membrane biogenesis